MIWGGRRGARDDGRGIGGGHRVENKCDFSCHEKEAMSFALTTKVYALAISC